MVKKLWKDIWTTLNKPIEIPWAEAISGGVESSKTVLELAKALQENRSAKELAPLIGQFSSLLDVLNNPLVQVAGTAMPVIPIATGVLKFLIEQTHQEPSLEVCISLIAQAAYLESFQQFLNEHSQLQDRLVAKPSSKAVEKQIKQLGEKLELEGKEFELNQKEAEETLVCFHESKLAKVFNSILELRFEESGLTSSEAKRVTERISRSTHRYMKRALAQVSDSVKQLITVYGGGWQEDLETYQSLDKYLEDIIAKQPKEKVFKENFLFEDIYVSLQVKTVHWGGAVNEQSTPIDIQTWAAQLLEASDKQGQVLFIQGGPGRGKSVFCRMFADWVRRELYPIWIPVLIQLRDIRNLSENFDEILRNVIGTNFVSQQDWLTDRNTRYLFLLDGFDELILERRASDELRQFLDRVGTFQAECNKISERKHRVLITGRPLALYGIELRMPNNLERVEILPMSNEIQSFWFGKWGTLVGSDNALKFQAFLGDNRCPEQVRILSKEPLLLYFLAAMHRDKRLQVEMFENSKSVQIKIQIYEAVLKWVLTEQRKDSTGRNLNPQLTGLELEDLCSVLAEAALCVVQSGGEYASISMIQSRLEKKENEGAKALLRAAKESLDDSPLKNALAAFYLESTTDGKNQDPKVEFSHKSFSEFLCAKRLQESLESWAERKGRSSRTYVIPIETMSWGIYDLLGFGKLTPEISEYLMGLLEKYESESQIDWVSLFERLETFYLRWSDDEVFEIADTDDLPQRKLSQLKGNRTSKEKKISLGQRQVDVYTGLNVLILLLEIHRFAQGRSDLQSKIIFHPCGQPGSDSFDEARLFRIVSYSQINGASTFVQSVGAFLSETYLPKAYLSTTNLSGINLKQADLSEANLVGADLTGAKLIGVNCNRANLSEANLTGADLTGADLRGANLTRANLNDANLANANLSQAILNKATLTRTNLSNADLIGANFERAFLEGTIVDNSNFIGADLSNTYHKNVDFQSANTTGADLGSS